MGAAMTLNLMYRDFHEELSLVSKYTLDIIFHMLFALRSAKNSTDAATIMN